MRSPLGMSKRLKALLLSPFVILIAAATRLLVISNGDTTVASSIAAARGVTGSLLGTVIPLLPPYLPLLALVFVLFRRLVMALVVAGAAILASPSYALPLDGWKYAVSSIPKLFTLAINGEWSELYRLAPQVLPCVALSAIFVFWGISEVGNRAASGPFIFVEQARYIGFGLICGVICTIGILFSQVVYKVPFDLNYAGQTMRRPWLPAEIILTDDHRMHTGYVLSTNDDWFLIMNDWNRSLEYIPSDSVIARWVCTPLTYQVEYRSPLVKLSGADKPSNRVCEVPASR